MQYNKTDDEKAARKT